MPGIDFAFCLHSHQPAGNLDHAIEQAYQKAYKPFLEVVQRHPGIRVILHYSGPLLLWIEKHHPEMLDVIRRLVTEGRAEMMTGGFYEPILAIVPERDQVGQIEALTRYLGKHFEAKPQGLWLTERVWQPELVAPLRRAGVRYTIVDDNNFQAAGVSEREGLGHFSVTDEEGSLEIFPINGTLRRAIPFQPPEEIIEHLRSLSGEGKRLALFADDGEKFGEWPGTSQHVYADGWLERFFRLLSENRGWIRMTTLSDYMHEAPSLGRVTLPTGSYKEMMEWSGGSWRNFLDRYPESNLMYRKMLLVSDEVAAMASRQDGGERAREHLYEGQSNDPYWHGVFGGIYLLHLRLHNYCSLLAAENIASPGSGTQVERTDFDGDGQEEVLVSSPAVNCYFHRMGGQIFELDHRAVAFNLLATLMRHRETYLEQQAGACFDWYPRRALIDHFLRDDTSIDSFSGCTYGEQGDFVNQPYDLEVEDRGPGATVTLKRDGGVWVAGKFLPVSLIKRVTLRERPAELEVRYRIEQPGKHPISLWFACECNLVLSSGRGKGLYYRFNGGGGKPPVDDKAAHSRVGEVALVDESLGCTVRLRFEKPVDLWTFPVETLSKGLEGLASSYQSSCVVPHWRIALQPGEPWSASFTISLE